MCDYFFETVSLPSRKTNCFIPLTAEYILIEMESKPHAKNITLHIILQSVMFVFFFQLLTDLLEAIYMLDLLNTSLDEKVLGILALFSPIIMIEVVMKRRFLSKPKYSKYQQFFTPQFLRLAFGAIVLICRLIDPLVSTAGRILAAGIGVAMFLMYFFEQFVDIHVFIYL